MRGHYFGFLGSLLTSFPHLGVWGFSGNLGWKAGVRSHERACFAGRCRVTEPGRALHADVLTARLKSGPDSKRSGGLDRVVVSHICQNRAEPFDPLRSLRPGCGAPGGSYEPTRKANRGGQLFEDDTTCAAGVHAAARGGAGGAGWADSGAGFAGGVAGAEGSDAGAGDGVARKGRVGAAAGAERAGSCYGESAVQSTACGCGAVSGCGGVSVAVRCAAEGVGADRG
jgi:hypothetical protein